MQYGKLLCRKETTTLPDRYRHFYGPLIRVLKENDLIAPLILDVGCSYGWAIEDLGKNLKQMGIRPSLVGLDPQLPSNVVRTLDGGIALGQYLPFKDNSFDVVICENVFFYGGKNDQDTLLEIRRVIKPTGFFCGDP